MRDLASERRRAKRLKQANDGWLASHMRRIEAQIIREAVWRCGGSQEEAAELLGTSPTTVSRRLRDESRELEERAEMPNGELK